MSLLAKISPHADERSARLASIGLMLLSVFMFSFGDATGKFIVATYSVGQLMCLRGCAALLLLAPMIWPQSIPHVVWAMSLAPPTPPPPPPPPEQPVLHARVIPMQSHGAVLYRPVSAEHLAGSRTASSAAFWLRSRAVARRLCRGRSG